MRQDKGSCVGCTEFARMERALRELSSLKVVMWQDKTNKKRAELVRWVENRALKGLGEWHE